MSAAPAARRFTCLGGGERADGFLLRMADRAPRAPCARRRAPPPHTHTHARARWPCN